MPGGGPETERAGWRGRLWQAAGAAAFAIGTVGIFLPLLPTVPLYILAAFCFGKGNPAWEARLLADRRFGPHIRAWRDRRAIAKAGKVAGVAALAGSAAFGLFVLPDPWRYAPLVVGAIVVAWMLSRPDA